MELLLANDLVLLLLCLGCKTLERACTQALFNLGLLLSDLADNAVNGYVEGVVLVLRGLLCTVDDTVIFYRKLKNDKFTALLEGDLSLGLLGEEAVQLCAELLGRIVGERLSTEISMLSKKSPLSSKEQGTSRSERAAAYAAARQTGILKQISRTARTFVPRTC